MNVRTSYRPGKAERPDALARLWEWISPGDTLYTVLRHKASSGMTRWISVLKITVEHPSRISNRPDEIFVMDLDYNVARVLDRSLSDVREGIKCEGAGMDMGFELVYNLSRSLFPDGFGCIGTGCPSNDHSNGDRDYTVHDNKHPHWHRDGGYALRHRWL